MPILKCNDNFNFCLVLQKYISVSIYMFHKEHRDGTRIKFE